MGGENRAWCYTTDPNKRWERCNIPSCGKTTGYHKEWEHRNIPFYVRFIPTNERSALASHYVVTLSQQTMGTL
jgi:hypothetical protein